MLFRSGARYALKPHGHYAPYLIGSGGLARLTRDVAFSVGRNEITDRLSQYGVTLGSDLTGDVSKLAATVGGGIAWTRFAPFSIGLDYRYSRIFDTTALSVNRAGLMFGVTF